MTISPDPLGPMLQPGTITTLVGPLDAELAALTAALAVSYKTGRPLIPGFVPEGPGEVTAYCYAGAEIVWKSLVAHICGAAGIQPAPVIQLRCLNDPLVKARAARDPDASSYWEPYVDADFAAEMTAAKAEGRQLPPPLLTIVFGLEEAAGDGGDGAMRQLYDEFRGQTVLMFGVEAGDEIAGSYGPVIELPDLHNSVRWRDLLAAVTGGDMPEADQSAEEPDLEPAGDVEVRHVGGEEVPEMLGAVRAFFIVEGAAALRAFLDDRDSMAKRELKARAKARGISSGRLWVAAKRIARDVAARPYGEPGTLIGYGAVFNQWQQFNGALRGHYLERIAPGAFTKAIAESVQRMKCTYSHGKDPEFGYKSLGPITVLEEDEFGVYYEVQLVDADYTRTLVPGLMAGLYRSSFTFVPLAEDFVNEPGKSAHNPDGLPELTIREVRCSELGPCLTPAYAGTSATWRMTGAGTRTTARPSSRSGESGSVSIPTRSVRNSSDGESDTERPLARKVDGIGNVTETRSTLDGAAPAATNCGVPATEVAEWLQRTNVPSAAYRSEPTPTLSRPMLRQPIVIAMIAHRKETINEVSRAADTEGTLLAALGYGRDLIKRRQL